MIAILGILGTIAAFNVGRLRQPADEAARALNSVLTASRARAIASTSAVRIQRPASSRVYTTSVATSCAAPASGWTTLPALTYTAPNDLTISTFATEWTSCFTSRGILTGSSTLPTVTFTDKNARSRTVTVYAGGATEVK
ncbi:hypothetical protein GCM10008960_40510 [Deinococcus sedimenti]|uniref:General secretion pathway GspH domain-containing protein n=1 Tax=Deinococcus sedimenti TaxID=1867090 RepID=A0ABQ2SC42_9DEIO|nr:hypothetical protein GCM10008960_40510 [Deinococcus sedimenti]